jgi:hypothetical protein
MSDHLKLCKEALLRAEPASGLKPSNAQEWRTFQRANYDFMFHMLRDNDVPKAKARAVAGLVWKTPIGRALFEAALDNNSASSNRGEEGK